MSTEDDLKATPGPWTCSPQKGVPGHCTMAQVWSPDGRSLADIEPTTDEAEASATAHLISAAPDLLECLKLAIKDQQTSFRIMSEANKEMGFDAPKKLDWVQKAEAAILKALGQS